MAAEAKAGCPLDIVNGLTVTSATLCALAQKLEAERE
jgi:hypothetical protein